MTEILDGVNRNNGSRMESPGVQDSVPPAQSQYFGDFIVKYNRNINGTLDYYTDHLFQLINELYAVIYVPLTDIPEIQVNNYSYNAIPKLYTYMDTEALNNSGIAKLHNHPYLNLRGQGTLIAVIDSGIDYQNPIFRTGDTSRILRIWDQTLVGEPVSEKSSWEECMKNFVLPYGREFTQEDINRALRSDNPLEEVPSRDENGHGTMMAGIAAGNALPGEGFSGAAPEASLLVVKLKPAKDYLKEFYLVPSQAEAYQENDIMMAIRYAMGRARQLKMPLSICLGLGSSQGDHMGTGPLSRFISSISQYAQNAVSVPAGNEGGTRHHYHGTVSVEKGQDTAELRVGNAEPGFTLEFWGNAPENYQISIQSPTGEVLPISTARGAGTQVLSFVFVGTRIEANYIQTEIGSGTTLAFIRFFQPAGGIWRILVSSNYKYPVEYHLWLPVDAFLTQDTYFLEASPYQTITNPGDAQGAITVTAYNHRDQSLFYQASRGYTVSGVVKPEIAAPGVEVLAPLLNGNFGSVSGTSVSAAQTAGAVALLFEWAVVRENAPYLNGYTVGSYLYKGVRRSENFRYPNPDWGYGQMDLYHTFELLG